MHAKLLHNRSLGSNLKKRFFVRESHAMGLKLTIAILASYFGAISAADAAFVIKLKNGNEFVTSRYWQDSKQVLFETYDGTFGVDKSFVSNVEKTEKPIRLITTSQAAAEVIKPAETTVRENSSEVKKSAVVNLESAPGKKLEDDPIMRHFQSIRDRSKNVDGMLTSELNLLAKDLGDLKRAMQLGGKTNDYLDEFRELHEIAERVEDAMTGRR